MFLVEPVCMRTGLGFPILSYVSHMKTNLPLSLFRCLIQLLCIKLDFHLSDANIDDLKVTCINVNFAVSKLQTCTYTLQIIFTLVTVLHQSTNNFLAAPSRRYASPSTTKADMAVAGIMCTRSISNAPRGAEAILCMSVELSQQCNLLTI